MNEFYECISCTDFDDFVVMVEELTRDHEYSWVFRGQSEACWDLKTSLERTCECYELSGGEASRREYNMVREFQRRLHHYEANVPRRNCVDEWMGLMQHYGAPTRLLDFTYSPYVAAYFAFEKAQIGKVSIWAINAAWLEKELKSNIKYEELRDRFKEYQYYRIPEAFKSLFLSNPHNRYILAVNPFRLNDRLAYQQGLFLCPASVHVGFMENLRDFIVPKDSEKQVKKYTIDLGEYNEHRNKALQRLHKMNINRITLFPGLVGFAESFKVGIFTVHGYHKMFDGEHQLSGEQMWQGFFERLEAL